MVNFAAGELALPIRRILWAPSNAAHHNHLHVEGPHVSGTLQQCTSKWTEAITTIRGALDGKFGVGDHYQVWDDTLGWTHMGVYHCRYIAKTTTPSQHAFSNAIDIGPYYGVAEQQKFYDFLTRKKGDDDMALSQEDKEWILSAIKGNNTAQTESNWTRYVIRNTAGTFVPLVSALQFIYRKLEQGLTVSVDEAAVADKILSKIKLVQE